MIKKIEMPGIRLIPTITLVLCIKAYILNLAVVLYLMNKENIEFSVGFLNYINSISVILPFLLIVIVLEATLGIIFSIYYWIKEKRVKTEDF